MTHNHVPTYSVTIRKQDKKKKIQQDKIPLRREYQITKMSREKAWLHFQNCIVNLSKPSMTEFLLNP